MKDVPRPLLILIVVIVILGVVSCGAGVFRGLNEDPPPNPSDAAVDGFVEAPVRRQDVRVEGVGGGSCSRLGPTISISSDCLLTVEPQAIRPRVLRLQVLNDPVDVTVRQEIDGELQPDDPETKTFNVFNDEDFEISIAGTSPIFVRLECGSCDLGIID